MDASSGGGGGWLRVVGVLAAAVLLQQYSARRSADAAARRSRPLVDISVRRCSARSPSTASAPQPQRGNGPFSPRLPPLLVAPEGSGSGSGAGGDDGGSGSLGHPRFVVEIEYCTGCRWLLRAAWLAQELLTTFQQEPTSRLQSVLLTPNGRQGGVFQVYLYALGAAPGDGPGERELLWSRKAVGRFPESKELKQIVRDHVCPDKGLGHSDK